nr:hypothetical protein [Tanacetum cinerariifolium]
STRVETSTTTQKPVRIIPGPAEYIKKFLEDVGEDGDFKHGSWISAIEYVNANGDIMSGCLGNIKNFFKNKSYTLNVLGDLKVTLKDLSDTIGGSIHHRVIDEEGYGKDITVEVFCKDTEPESDNGIGESGMLNEKEIIKLLEEMVGLELQELLDFLFLGVEGGRALGSSGALKSMEAMGAMDLMEALKLEVEAVGALDLMEVKAVGDLDLVEEALDLLEMEATCLIVAQDLVDLSLNILISASVSGYLTSLNKTRSSSLESSALLDT